MSVWSSDVFSSDLRHSIDLSKNSKCRSVDGSIKKSGGGRDSMKGRREAVVKVACCQMGPVVGRKDANIAKSVKMSETAAGKGARLVVLPELANSGYVFESREEAWALAEEIPHGKTCEAWEIGRASCRERVCQYV